MKKVFLPIIAAAMYLAASATPASFNYQGVCDYKNAKNVEVTFTLSNADGSQVYKDKQYVETNAEGMFTTIIGNDDLGGYDFENDTWTLTTTVGGLTTVCNINAVPYALSAKGLDYAIAGVSELTDAVRMKADVAQVAELEGAIEELQEAVKAMNDIEGDGLGAWTAEQIGSIHQSLDYISTDIDGLVAANRMRATEIGELQEWQKEAARRIENADMMGDVARVAYDMAEANEEAIAALQDLHIANRLENADMMGDVAAAAYDMADANADAIEVLKATVANNTEVGDNQAVVIKKLQDSLAEVKVDAQGTSTQVDKLQEGLSVVEDDVRDLVKNFEPKVNGDIADLRTDLEANVNLAQSLSEDLYKEDGIVDQLMALNDLNLPNVVENLDMMTPMLQEMEKNITALQEGADVLSTDVEKLVKANRENQTDIAQLQIDVQGVGELVNNAGTVAYQTAEDLQDYIASNDDAIADLQGQIATIKKQIEVLYGLHGGTPQN